MRYRVVPIPEIISEEVRATLRSPQYGHPAHVEVAPSYGPCRSCLRTFEVGEEERVLFTYNPFAGPSDLPAPGPVFIHKEKCAAFAGEDFPADLRRLPLLLEGYGEGSELVRRQDVVSSSVEDQIDEMLSLPGVNYVNIRNAEAGCFVARIEREAEAVSAG